MSKVQGSVNIGRVQQGLHLLAIIYNSVIMA